ncbi:tRNA lysidine(34) synthetase TilS [Cellulomonas carbonis]|uniref:tRNA lysidine(34) synthetase TilS n=1 Tax=Cellulomonas carbonis TaxID=1386092 RepID=UPI0016637849|nr:tRNA lysidine(34) synthetase TilS [Cellulomonas carbonis]GGC04884.1 tRNA(Ile)-lysidine synthase [Cellulomonas carbonis]
MTGPAPEVAALRVAVRSCLADVPAGSLVLVACSGGADSLALAAATAFVAQRAGLRAGAVVVDHGLQPRSDVVAAGAGRVCRALGLDPVDVVRVEVGAAGGPEAAARDARYAALDAAASRHTAQAVLLGHTLDDQAETVLLGLARGSGARSLAGMPARRGVLRRPLLDVPRTTTRAACEALGLEPWDDPTNGPAGAAAPGAHGPRPPLRSRVRHEVLPVLESVLGPGVRDALARTARQLAEDADALDLAARELLAQAQVQHDGVGAGLAVLDVGVLAGAPAAVRRRALRAALVGAGVPAGALHRSHVLAVDALVTDWHGQGAVALPGGRRAARSCGRLAVGAAEVAPPTEPGRPAASTREQ